MRYLSARRPTNTTASGSSALTWKIGTSSILATSLQYMVERRSAGSEVVKPTWLLMITCAVPPVKKPRACDSCSVSITTPWPANAASPCTSSGSTRAARTSPRRSWRARTEPSPTGSTPSRCQGLDAGGAASLYEVIEQRNERIRAFEREALLADVLGVQVALEAFGGRELPEDVALLFGTEAMLEAPLLELILQPQPLLGVGHVREL